MSNQLSSKTLRAKEYIRSQVALGKSIKDIELALKSRTIAELEADAAAAPTVAPTDTGPTAAAIEAEKAMQTVRDLIENYKVLYSINTVQYPWKNLTIEVVVPNLSNPNQVGDAITPELSNLNQMNNVITPELSNLNQVGDAITNQRGMVISLKPDIMHYDSCDVFIKKAYIYNGLSEANAMIRPHIKTHYYAPGFDLLNAINKAKAESNSEDLMCYQYASISFRYSSLEPLVMSQISCKDSFSLQQMLKNKETIFGNEVILTLAYGAVDNKDGRNTISTFETLLFKKLDLDIDNYEQDNVYFFPFNNNNSSIVPDPTLLELLSPKVIAPTCSHDFNDQLNTLIETCYNNTEAKTYICYSTSPISENSLDSCDIMYTHNLNDVNYCCTAEA